MIKRLLIIVGLLSLVVAGCDASATTGNGSSQSGTTIQSPPMPANLTQAAIVKVVDGDTVDVSLNGKTTRVRLIGINTPETVDPRKTIECFGNEASAKAKEILT